MSHSHWSQWAEQYGTCTFPSPWSKEVLKLQAFKTKVWAGLLNKRVSAHETQVWGAVLKRRLRETDRWTNRWANSKKASSKYIWQSDFIPPSDVSTHAHVRLKVPGRWKVDVSLRNTRENKRHGRGRLPLSSNRFLFSLLFQASTL